PREVGERLERRRRRRLEALLEEGEDPVQRARPLDRRAHLRPRRPERRPPRGFEGVDETVPDAERGAPQRRDRAEEVGPDEAYGLPVGEREQRKRPQVRLEARERAPHVGLGLAARRDYRLAAFASHRPSTLHERPPS